MGWVGGAVGGRARGVGTAVTARGVTLAPLPLWSVPATAAARMTVAAVTAFSSPATAAVAAVLAAPLGAHRTATTTAAAAAAAAEEEEAVALSGQPSLEPCDV